jgi:hypothetical protein
MQFDLSDDETAALTRLLRKAIEDDRYPLSPRIRVLQSILDKLDPPPVHEPLRWTPFVRQPEPLVKA